MKKETKQFVFFTAATALGIFAYNKIVNYTSTKKNLLSADNGEFYDWENGRIFYHASGSGKPLLLIHDTNPGSSSYEWNKMVRKLSKNHKVYTLDLIGCGRSDKPNYHYTNYLYVQLISSFVKEVIQKKTDVVVSNISSSYVIMANNLDKELFDKIILINPVSMRNLNQESDKNSKIKQLLFQLPLIGTFAYNVMNNPFLIDLNFRKLYFHSEQSINNEMKDTFYESAHLDNSNGRYLYSSMMGNYLNTNLLHADHQIDKPIYIIGSKDLRNNTKTLGEYQDANEHFEIITLTNSNLYPQLEIPDRICTIVEHICE